MPFNASELPQIDFAQAFDTVYTAHLNHEPGKLQRYSHTDWRFTSLTFGSDVPPPGDVAALATTPNTDAANSGAAYFPQESSYVVTAVNEETGQESLPSTASVVINDLTLKKNYTTVSWSAVTGANYYRVYKRRNQGEYGLVGQTEQLTFRDDNIIADLTDGPLQGRNPLTGEGNRPATVFFFDQRLGYACTANNPNGMYLSRSADFENMDVARPVRADDAISIRLVAEKVNAINQVLPMDDLLGLTSTGIFVIRGSNDDYLSANPPPKSRRRSARGVSRLKAITIDTVALYTLDSGDGVYSLSYSLEQDGQKSADVSVFSPHLFEGFRIHSWAYAEKPHSIVWAARSDGKLLSFTWEQDQEVWGWTGPHDMGGFVNWVAAVPENGEHRVYLSITRNFGGEARHFIERMASVRVPENAALECYLDCAVSQQFETPTKTIPNLHHLEGRTVSVLADGDAYADKLVQNGEVTLEHEVTIATVGLPYVGKVETLPVIYPSQGTNAGKPQSLGQVALKVVKTRGLKVGRREAEMYALRARENENIGTPTDRVTGTFNAAVEPVQSGGASLIIRQEKPFSWRVTSVFLDPVLSG
ncbi:MAG TPA: hypothetical protein VF655_00185 [Allosphingosinicella sp.]|jgi:hypothetical protein